MQYICIYWIDISKFCGSERRMHLYKYIYTEQTPNLANPKSLGGGRGGGLGGGARYRNKFSIASTLYLIYHKSSYRIT